MKDPKGDAYSYIRSMILLNEYFHNIHGGVENYLKSIG